MSDDVTYFGTDTARYQPLGTYDPGAFEIVNYQDPERDAKVVRNRAVGRPSGVYLWVYPGHDLYADTAAMVRVVRSIHGGDLELGYWADYEDPGGISEGQLHAFFAALADAHAYGGYYAGPFALNHGAFLDHDWWNAAYPTGGAAFPGYGSLWASSRPRPMKLWQWTSWGGLDRDVVTENPWYEATIHVTPPPPAPKPVPKENDDMVEINIKGVAYHLWASGGRIYVRSSRGGGLGDIVAVPGDYEVDMGNPRPLVIDVFGTPAVFFVGTNGREVTVEWGAPPQGKFV